MNIQLSALNRILILGGIFVIISLLAFFFVFQPKRQQENLTRAQIADLQQRYDQLKKIADQKPLYLALTDQIRQRLKGVEVTADPRTYIPSYLKQIEDLAAQDGLLVTSVAPQATAPPSPSPSASPGASVRTPNLPGPISAPAGHITNALGAQNAQSAQNGESGQPSPAAPGAAAPAQGGPPGTNPAGVQPGTPRAAALAYLNQSFTQVPIAMSLDGRYESFVRFLRDLNKFQKLIGVGDVTLASGGGEAAAARLKITLPITAYRLSPNAPPSGPLVTGTPAPKPTPGGAR
jgi:Tfp pilus assembly protein PilO